MGSLKTGILVAMIIIAGISGTGIKYLWDRNTMLQLEAASYKSALKQSSDNLEQMSTLIKQQQAAVVSKDHTIIKLREHASRVGRVAERKPRQYTRLVNEDHEAFWRGLEDETKQQK